MSTAGATAAGLNETDFCSSIVDMSGSNQGYALDELRFLADAMLGKLARYLRMSGVDTAYRRVGPVADPLEAALESGRILLTRNRSLTRRCSGRAYGPETRPPAPRRNTGTAPRRDKSSASAGMPAPGAASDPGTSPDLARSDAAPGSVVPACFDPGSDDAGAQFRSVWTAFRLWDRPRRRRCVRCNTPLEARPLAECGGGVPDHIVHTHLTGWVCPNCNRYYWAGSHAAAFRRRFADLKGINQD